MTRSHDREALKDAISDALHRHLASGEDAEDVWARIDDSGAIDDAEDVGDVESAIKRYFEPEDHRRELVLGDVRPVATRVLGNKEDQ